MGATAKYICQASDFPLKTVDRWDKECHRIYLDNVYFGYIAYDDPDAQGEYMSYLYMKFPDNTTREISLRCAELGIGKFMDELLVKVAETGHFTQYNFNTENYIKITNE